MMSKKKIQQQTYYKQTIYIFMGSGNALLLFVYDNTVTKRWMSYHDMSPYEFVRRMREHQYNSEVLTISRNKLEDIYRNYLMTKALLK